MNEPENKVKIFLVDDHKIFREGIKALFLGENEFVIVDEACDGEEFLNKLDYDIPDLALIDIELPDINGIKLSMRLDEEYPQLKKIILSADQSEYCIAEAIKAGVNGYLHKDTTKEEIVKAIHAVMRGEQYFGDSISKTIFSKYTRQIKGAEGKISDNKSLSDREIEIIKLLCNGFTYKKIADELNISVRTVESHKNNIQDKLNIHSIPELVRFALKHNYID